MNRKSSNNNRRMRWGRLLRWKNALNHDYKNNNGRSFQLTKFSFIDFVLTNRRSLSGKRPVENWTESVTWIFVCFLPPTNWTLNSWWKLKKGKWKGMRESCLVYCYSGMQSLFEVVLLYTFYTRPKSASGKSSSCWFSFSADRNANTKATEYATFGFSLSILVFFPF